MTNPMAIETADEFAARLDNEVEEGLLCYDDLVRETKARDKALRIALLKELVASAAEWRKDGAPCEFALAIQDAERKYSKEPG